MGRITCFTMVCLRFTSSPLPGPSFWLLSPCSWSSWICRLFVLPITWLRFFMECLLLPSLCWWPTFFSLRAIAVPSAYIATLVFSQGMSSFGISRYRVQFMCNQPPFVCYWTYFDQFWLGSSFLWGRRAPGEPSPSRQPNQKNIISSIIGIYYLGRCLRICYILNTKINTILTPSRS